MNKKYLPEIVYSTLAMIMTVLPFFLLSRNDVEPTEQKSSWYDDHCFKTIIPPEGGVITEYAGGEFNYTLLARSDGAVEVWENRRCE